MAIIISATLAAIICIPVGLIFGWVFDPIILVNVIKNLLWLILCWPYWLVWKRLLKRLWNRSSFVVAPAPQSYSSTVDIRMRQAALAEQNATDQTLVFDIDTEDNAQGSPTPPPSPREVLLRNVVPLMIREEFCTLIAPPWPPPLLVNVESSTRMIEESLA